jgi:hypothetical protein
MTFGALQAAAGGETTTGLLDALLLTAVLAQHAVCALDADMLSLLPLAIAACPLAGTAALRGALGSALAALSARSTAQARELSRV